MTAHEAPSTAPTARELGEQQAMKWLASYYKAMQRITWFRELDHRFFWDLSYPEWFRRTVSLTTTTTFAVCGIIWGIITLLLLFRYIIPLFWWLCSRPAALIAEIARHGGTPQFKIEFADFMFGTLMMAVGIVILANFLDRKSRRNFRVLVETTWFLANDGWVREQWAILTISYPNPGVLKYCPNCSLGLPAHASYCWTCGHDQSKPAPAQPYTVIYTDSVGKES